MKKALTINPGQNIVGDVYALIANLSSAERISIRKSWSKSKGKKLPLHLHFFEQIADGHATDDTSAQATLGIGSGAQFSNLKHHVVNEILDFLVNTGRNERAEVQLQHGLIQLKILAERCAPALARRLAKKYLQIAQEGGNYGIAYEILTQKLRLVEQHSFRQYTAEAAEVAALRETYAAYHHTAQHIQGLTDQLIFLRMGDQLIVSGELRNTIQSIGDTLSALQDKASATPHLKIRHSAASVLAAYMLQQYETCTACCAEALALLEREEGLAASNPESFLIAANIAFYNEFARGAVSRVSDWLYRLDRIANTCKGDYFFKRWEIIRFNTTLKIAHKTADFESVAQIVDGESGTITAYCSQTLQPAEALSVLASISISQFVLERFSAAEELMLEIKELNRSLERQDVFYFTLVFHLVILYELKDWYRLDTATVAAYHVLYNHKKLRPFEKELMSFLKALPAKRANGGTMEFIRAFIERLEVYRSDPAQRLYFLYFNYYDWLQSKLAGTSYREYKRQLLANAQNEPD